MAAEDELAAELLALPGGEVLLLVTRLRHDLVDEAGELLVTGGELCGEPRLDLGDLLRQPLVTHGDAARRLALATGDLLLDLVLQQLERVGASLVVHLGDDVVREVEDALQRARRHVQQQPQPARHALGEPDVRDGRGEADVAHPLAPHLGARHLDAALVADDALVTGALVLTAVALEVLGRAEDLLAEEPVLLRLQRAVVDRLGLRDLAVRPGLDLGGRGEREPDRVEVIDLEH